MQTRIIKAMFDIGDFLKKQGIKKSYRDLAGELNLDNKTLYNWRKSKKKQKLLRIIAKGYLFEKLECNVKSFMDNDKGL